jgi:hypothetical protein
MSLWVEGKGIFKKLVKVHGINGEQIEKAEPNQPISLVMMKRGFISKLA